MKKTLKLFDVYAICTGAMFSAEFFMLPGIAASFTGSSVTLAYLASGVLVLPAMFSQAELATAMPKAGGTYYFNDRSLGPLAGTIGGIGTWLSLVFKSAFALVGMGAYLIFFVDLPMKPVAIALTVAFVALNIVGVKETSGFQRFLVTTLVTILAFFVAQGLLEIFTPTAETATTGEPMPFLSDGLGGFLTTIGLVFAAYAGLTKVASVAEEVQNPDRNIPLGMMLSLGTAVAVYTVGVYLVVEVLPVPAIYEDLTPIATAAQGFMDWMPGEVLGISTGVFLIIISAMAAFISTGNAGILAASRYPLAMARDRLITRRFEKVGRFDTPTSAIVVTGASMILFIALFDVEAVAKLASAFNLLVFGLINLAVIVMRESHIPNYAPHFRTPLYPWTQILGILTSIVLIILIGTLSIVFTLAIIVCCIGWYTYYVRTNVEVEREGAIYHLFERLGRRRYEGLDKELDTILEEKGFGDDAPFDRLVASSPVLDLDNGCTFEDIVSQVSALLATRLDTQAERLKQGFLRKGWHEHILISHGATLPHYRLTGIDHPEMVLVRCRSGIVLNAGEDGDPTRDPDETIYALFFLVSPSEKPSQHLRILANVASQVDRDAFLDEWRKAPDEQALREVLVHYERRLSVRVKRDARSEAFIGMTVKDLNLPTRLLIALILRNGEIIIPDGSTVIEEGDQLTIVGEPAGINRFHELYS